MKQTSEVAFETTIEAVLLADGFSKSPSAKLKTKRPYGKGEHSFALLEKINPVNVEAGGFARRVIEKVKAVSNLPLK